MESKHSLFKSFSFAFEGLKVALANGRNFRIQLTVGLAAILTGLFLNISGAEWVGLFLIISLVLILELLNTSVEAIVDLVSPEIRDRAKTAKDVSAAAVLIASFAAGIIGTIIFLPKTLTVLGLY